MFNVSIIKLMFRLNEISFYVLLLFILVNNCTSQVITECEKRSPNSYTKVQKQQLCQFTSNNFIGPAICATVAKQILYLKFEMILELCQYARSSAPVQCMNTLDSKSSNLHGIELCKDQTSTLSGECYMEISNLSSNKLLKLESIVSFCKELNDRSPLLCIQAAKNTTLVSIQHSIEYCKDAIGEGLQSNSYYNRAVSNCIYQMKSHVNPSFGLTGLDVLKFCVESNPKSYSYDIVALDNDITSSDENEILDEPDKYRSEPAECFVRSSHFEGRTFTMKQRLALCMNAPNSFGPINCVEKILLKGPSGDPGTKLSGDDLHKLCHGARNIGPADCFIESRNLGSNLDRTTLCNGAINNGPAKCFRRSSSVLKNDAHNRTLLCVSAESEDPAICASTAPHYLAISEKIELCSNTPNQRGQDSVRCLQAIESQSKLFQNAPKKGLGYFLDNLWDSSDRKSRGLLINMCSYGSSQAPLASAECFKSIPKSLNHDDAARMCTNISSAEVIQHMQLCYKILPTKEWSSDSASILCEHTSSREQVEAAVKCAFDAVKFSFPKLNHMDAAKLCTHEQIDGSILSCLRDLTKLSGASPGVYLISPEIVVQTCRLSSTKTLKPGCCLAQLASISTSKLVFDASVAPYICGMQEPSPIIICLESLGKRMISVDDAEKCVDTKQEIKTIRVKRILSDDNSIDITAGKRFLLWFELLDQYGRRFSDPRQEVIFSASLNNNNPQGAILWGMRTNFSTNGILQLDILVISQPGPVEFKISAKSFNTNNQVKDTKLIEVFRLNVREDPVMSNTTPCIYVLKKGFCPIGLNVADWESEFPRIRSYVSYEQYLLNIYCTGDVLNAWHVNAFMNVDGSMWIEYRLGIDSILTGLGMPIVEMNAVERLGLNDNNISSSSSSSSNVISSSKHSRRNKESAMQKMIRRAYYRKSLQWHPDRWVGLSIYSLAVQTAFELINEAYQMLTASDDTQKDDDVVVQSHSVPFEPPVYD